MVSFVKSIQSQGDSELSQMRNFMQDKLNEDHLTTVKSKEKSSVLFSEIVRLGEANEKQQEMMTNITL